MDENMQTIHDFNNEVEAEEAPKNAAEAFLNGPLTGGEEKAASPVQVKKNEVIEEKIDKASKPKTAFLSKAIQGKKKGEKILGSVTPDISEMPVPSGGVGLLLFISLLIVFAITPAVSGGKSTRLSLLWQAILGNATLPGGTAQASPMQPPPGFSPNVPYIPGPFDVIQGVIQGGV